MANVSYPQMGAIKSIVLPVPPVNVQLTLAEYKEKYGIDLREFLEIDGLAILLKRISNTIIYVESDTSAGVRLLYAGRISALVPISAGFWDDYKTVLGVYNNVEEEVHGICFTVLDTTLESITFDDIIVQKEGY